MTLPLDIDSELAGRAAYLAFLLEIRDYLPHEASEWDSVPAPLKQAWAAAAVAAHKQLTAEIAKPAETSL